MDDSSGISTAMDDTSATVVFAVSVAVSINAMLSSSMQMTSIGVDAGTGEGEFAEVDTGAETETETAIAAEVVVAEDVDGFTTKSVIFFILPAESAGASAGLFFRMDEDGSTCNF